MKRAPSRLSNGVPAGKTSSDFASMRVKLVIWVFFFGGVIAAVMRIMGTITGVSILSSTFPIEMINGSIAAFLLCTAVVYGIKNSRYSIIYIVSFLTLNCIIATHLFLGPSAEIGAWNTPMFELSRSSALGIYLYSIFYITPELGCNRIRLGRSIIQTNFVLIFFSILQVQDIIPHFYYQWYQGRHLARPTGGLEHPHFFAVLLVLSIAVAFILKSNVKKGENSRLLVFSITTSAFGVVISTSRVGFISFLTFFPLYVMLKNRLNTSLVYLLSALYVAAMAILLVGISWGELQDTIVGRNLEVFLSAFRESFSGDADSGAFLRGRGERWSHELELIMADSSTLLFGYGHQPYVSHNLILRQLQVSGVVGTVSYVLMLFSAVMYWLKYVHLSQRAVIISLLASLGVASITFPVFVSVPIVSGLVCIALLTISREEKSGLTEDENT